MRGAQAPHIDGSFQDTRAATSCACASAASDSPRSNSIAMNATPKHQPEIVDLDDAGPDRVAALAC